MDRRRIQYVLIALAILVALVGSYYGITLPAPAVPPVVPEDAGLGAASVRERISIEASEDVILKSGADLNVYADSAKATRVLQIDGTTGDFTGKVLGYPTPGLSEYCGQSTITGTETIGAATHGFTTAVYRAICTLAQDPTGDAASCTHSTTGYTTTLKVWSTALTPVANATGAVVDYCVIGK